MTKNVLLIVIDQFRADCLKSLVDRDQLPSLADSVPLPNLRALMAQGMTFNQHYTVTTPCGPSRASLLTGLYAMNHRSVRNGTPLGKHHETLGTYIRQAGYEPMLFGYTDASVDPRGLHANDPELRDYEGLSQGFAEMLRLRLESPGPWVGYLKRKGYDVPDNYWDLYKPKLDLSTATEEDPQGSPIRSPALYSAEDSDTAFLTNRVLETLAACENKPWFSLVTYIRPHPPLVAPSPYNTCIDPDSLPKPHARRSIDSMIQNHPFYKAYFSSPCNTGLYAGFDGDHRNLSERHIAEMRAVYLGLAVEVDEHIGRLINYLKDSGKYDDTLIVVTADHGEMLGDNFLWGKNSFMDSSLRIPLIIRDPARPESHGSSTNLLTESVDITPTLLHWCDVEKPLALDGSSLLPLMEEEEPIGWRQYVFAEAELGEPDSPTQFQQSTGLSARQSNYAVLRDKHYKYVHFNGGLESMLFDVEKDPGEETNLAQLPDYAHIVRQFSSRMLDHRMSCAEHSLSDMKLTKHGVFHTQNTH